MKVRQSRRITACERFYLRLSQIIKDRVFSHISRNKYMWNSLPGGLLVLPEYSTHLAHFPFYYLGLGKHAQAVFDMKLLIVLSGDAEVQITLPTDALYKCGTDFVDSGSFLLFALFFPVVFTINTRKSNRRQIPHSCHRNTNPVFFCLITHVSGD